MKRCETIVNKISSVFIGSISDPLLIRYSTIALMEFNEAI